MVCVFRLFQKVAEGQPAHQQHEHVVALRQLFEKPQIDHRLRARAPARRHATAPPRRRARVGAVWWWRQAGVAAGLVSDASRSTGASREAVG
jgi:hypothetical protein